MTLNEITTAITAMPIDSQSELLEVPVAYVEEGVYIVDGWHYCSTALTAAEAVQDMAY